ncbi:hypothetical protein F5X99DRAFT_372430 [Biscogniauxia marginata]|nr:hypothetical protein F5X99DRAFT_372430 [Biscogniauxia marginata]
MQRRIFSLSFFISIKHFCRGGHCRKKKGEKGKQGIEAFAPPVAGIFITSKSDTRSSFAIPRHGAPEKESWLCTFTARIARMYTC